MANIVINTNLLILISAIIFVVVALAIIYIIYKDRKQDKDEIEDLLNSITKEEPVKDKKTEKIEKTSKEEPEDISEIELVLNKMQKNLEAKPEEVVANFEKEQEEKAIISYQELVKTLKKGPDGNIVKIDDDDLDMKEPIEDTLNLGEMVEEIKNPKKITTETPIMRNEKFKNTEFISPIYGKMDEHLEYPKIKNFSNGDELEKFDEIYDSYNIENYLEEFSDNNVKVDSLEQTLDLEPISKEIKKNEEFLEALKEFRENL